MEAIHEGSRAEIVARLLLLAASGDRAAQIEACHALFALAHQRDEDVEDSEALKVWNMT